jgi:hypothetical protein
MKDKDKDEIQENNIGGQQQQQQQQQQQHVRTFEQYGFSFFIIDNAFQFTSMLR